MRRLTVYRYYLPSDIAPYIDYITPGVSLSRPLTKIKSTTHFSKQPRAHIDNTILHDGSATSLTHCGQSITPACIKALYDIPDPKHVYPENSLGVFEEDSIYDQQDLDLFFSHYAPWVPNETKPTLVSINNATAPGPPNMNKANGEALIDFDIVFSLIYPQAVTLYECCPAHRIGAY